MPNYFLSAEEYISACNGDTTDMNCIMFALCYTKADPIRGTAFNVNPENGDNLESLAKGFLRTVDKNRHKLGFSSENFRRIASEDIARLPSGTYVFKVYGFDDCSYTFMGFMVPRYDFHVMRGLRSASGEIHWEHKMGWDRAPGEVTPKDLDYLEEQYHDKFVYFAFTPPSR